MKLEPCTSYKLAQKIVKLEMCDYDRVQEEIEKVLVPIENKLEVAMKALTAITTTAHFYDTAKIDNATGYMNLCLDMVGNADKALKEIEGIK